MMPRERTTTWLAIALLGALLLPTALAIGGSPVPGKERWPIKTSVPTGAALDQPTRVQYGAFAALGDAPGVAKNDRRYQDARIPTVTRATGLREGEIIAVVGFLHLVAGEADGDYHMQIAASAASQTSCVVVEVPKDDPAFVASAPLRARVAQVRLFVRERLLGGKAPSQAGTLLSQPPLVRVSGQLFFDSAHVGDRPRGKRGCAASTLWEIHPVTGISIAEPNQLMPPARRQLGK